MIDMETLATSTDTVILTIGAVIFDPLGQGVIDSIDLRPTIDEQTEYHDRTINEATMDWWSKQSPEAIMEAMGDDGRISYKEAMQKLARFSWQCEKVWSNGSVFDIMIAEHAFKQLGINCPWQFYNIRDCRTLYDMAGVSLKDGGYVTTHRAIQDAERQAVKVQEAYRKLAKAGFIHIK